MSYPAIAIANHFVDHANRNKEDMTNMKLLKLVYFAQAIHLALYEKPLFPERVEAWRYGPVVPEVYHLYKRYGADPIPSVPSKVLPTIDADTKAVLNAVYDKYGHLSGPKLSGITHKAGSPWDQAYNSDNSRYAFISHESMKEYYQDLMR